MSLPDLVTLGQITLTIAVAIVGCAALYMEIDP